MKIIKFIDKLLNFILIMFFIIVILFSGYALYDVQLVYNEAELSEDILKYKPKTYEEENVEEFNLADLQENVNEDICGWIRIDGTNIDYPILAPNSMTEYLNKDYKKKYSIGGSIFLNYANDRLFNDDYEIIYGHNMVKNLMFSDIGKYEDSNFFENNKTGMLYTQNNIYKVEIYTFNILDSSKDIAYKIDDYKNGKNEALLENFEKSAIYKNDIEIGNDDKFILLSTCYDIGTAKRAVLFCKLGKIDASININEFADSDIERDEKVAKRESFNENRKFESKQIIDELNKYSYKNNKTGYEKIKDYLVELIENPMRLGLYILIFITILIYIKAFINGIKKKKKKNTNDERIYNSRIERINIKRILKLLGIENSKYRNNIRKSKKGKHSI